MLKQSRRDHHAHFSPHCGAQEVLITGPRSALFSRIVSRRAATRPALRNVFSISRRGTVKCDESDSSFITARRQNFSEAQLNFAAGRRPDPRTSLRAAPIRAEERDTALHHTQQPKNPKNKKPNKFSVISESTRESKFGT